MCGNPLKSVGKLFGLNPAKPVVQSAPPVPVLQDLKTPSVNTTIDQIQQEQSGISGGIANTLLTGAAGVDDQNLRLARKTLLGG